MATALIKRFIDLSLERRAPVSKQQ
jgi:hypothetical protein